MIRLYDDYTHLTLDRRGFMDNLARLAGGSAAAAAVLPLIAARPGAVEQVAENDARLVTENVTWAGASGPMLGYLVRPVEAAPPLPAVLVIHENRGLNDHIRDVTRRMALEGFITLAPDFLAPAGGTPADEDLARELIRDLDAEVLTDNLVSAAGYLRGRDDTTGAVGAIGFCWGGGMVGALAVADPDLRAAVPFYGSQPPAERVPAIRARMMMHYAGLDERINAGIPDFRAALDAAGTDYVIHMYEGANHAFLNDTSAARHDPEAAALAWERTVDFLRESLAED
jgi:carboxymethylenebutenolidase